MSWKDLFLVILASAGAGAFISSVINGLFAASIKKQELLRQDEQFALRLTEMKHQQLVAAQQWAAQAEGRARPIDLWDPLVTAIGYLRGLQEYRRTGRWEEGEASHED
jgi:hypothetical protein